VPRVGWAFDDPAGLPLERVRQIRDEIEAHVVALVRELDATAVGWVRQRRRLRGRR